jgi:hypothetical protein
MPSENDMDSKAPDEGQAGEGVGANIEESHTTDEEKANIPPDTHKSKGTETELHHNALDLIGTVLSDEYKGDKRKFFAEHPNLAEKANKSGKYKEAYRGLIASSDKKQEDEEDDTIDEDTLAERIYQKTAEKTLSEQRKTLTNEFAVKEGINRDEIETLHKAAEALHKASGQPFARCLEGVKITFKETLKAKTPVKIPSGDGISKEGDDNKAEIIRLAEKHGVSEKQAERFLKNSKGYDGSLDKWVTV